MADIRGTPLETKVAGSAAAAAFRLADAARGSGVHRALAAASVRAAANEPGLAKLVRRQQDERKEIAALYRRLADLRTRPTGEQDAGMLAALTARIEDLRASRTTLAREIEAAFPDYADLVHPKPASVEDVRALLRPDEAMVSIYLGEERAYLWAFPADGSLAFAVAEIGRERVLDQVQVLRLALDNQARTIEEVPAFRLDIAHDLYRMLLAPVAAGWQGAKSLLVVPHGALGFLPFSLLVTAPAEAVPANAVPFAEYRGVPWLARSHALTTLPTAAALASLRGTARVAGERRAFVGFGDPVFSLAAAANGDQGGVGGSRGLALRATPATADLASAQLARLPRLPDTRAELESIARALGADPARDLFLGPDANEERVKETALDAYRVIAFATHGLVPGDLDSLTQPALALSAPEVTGVAGDGLLTMGEVLRLRLDADWVVLSACNTGSGDGAGAEAVSGLGRAFFYAGTRAVLVSNWPVHSASAKALTTDIFARQAADPALGRAEALRGAMLALMDGPGHPDPAGESALFSYAHPMFWGPFTVVGDGGI